MASVHLKLSNKNRLDLATWRAKVNGKRIVNLFYLDSKQAQDYFGWDYTGVVLMLEDGSVLIPMSDEEGNGPGAVEILTKDDVKERHVMYTMPIDNSI